MINEELLTKIKAEIERLRSNMDDREPLAPNQKAGYLFALADVLSFLSTIESETPMREDLENEIGKIWETCEPVDEGMGVETANIHIEQFDYLARHFAEWGAEHLADVRKMIEPEKYENIPNDLEKAAEISFYEAYALTGDYTNFLAKGLTENQPRPIGPHWFCEYAKNRFIAGAKWDREQMLKDAVEGTYNNSDWGTPCIDLPSPLELERFDKVKIIIIKED